MHKKKLNPKYLKIIFILLIFCNPFLGQQRININATLDTVSQKIKVSQNIVYKNPYNKAINKLIINDWNHAYSNRKTKLGQRFSDQFVRNFHLSTAKERGYTEIKSVTVNKFYGNWCRIDDQIDLIELQITPLSNKDSISIDIEYELKIPDAKFTRWGREKKDFYLKDCFLGIAKINEVGIPLQYSNENIDDATLENIESIKINFNFPSEYHITSNLTKTDSFSFQGQNCNDFQFAIEKKNSFESYSNDILTVETNLNDSKINEIQKALIIDKVIQFFNKNIGSSKATKIMIAQTDYDRNPFYGLNQLPTFLSPFPNSFLFELKFLKAYSNNLLKQNLNIDFRKDHYLLDAFQTYFLINYIEEFYPDIPLVGTLGQFKITKGYQLARAKFNDQYYLAYLLMARKNLDQGLNKSKENLVKFNEQITSKYKAGLFFKYLDNYLNNNELKTSIKEFIQINKTSSSDSEKFEEIVKSKTNQNINWFFNELIHSNTSIDYNFGSIIQQNNTKAVIINNKTNTKVPYLISGYKNRKKITETWINNPQKDSIFTFDSNQIDRLVINKDNFFPEINNRNNYKATNTFALNKPIKFSFIRDVENANYSQVFYVPEIGYNLYDGAILSLTFNNKSLIERPFTYLISPSYSTNSKSFSGNGSLTYNLLKDNSKNYSTRFSLSSSYFHYIQDASYLRVTPSVIFRFRENNLLDNKGQALSFRQVSVKRDYSPLSRDTITPLNYSIFDARYSIGDSETAKGYGLVTNLQFGDKFGKFVTELNYRKLFENNYQITFRLFAGTFLYNNTNTDFYSFGLDRPKDYLFDYSFYGRSENAGLFSQQIIIAEGGFKSKFKNPYANQWMASLNTTSSIWKWIEVYADAGMYKNKFSDPKFVFDTGLHFNFLPGYFELYFPVYSSNGFELNQGNYDKKIRFVVTLSPKTLINLFTRKWF